jgi:hypothetical protein
MYFTVDTRLEVAEDRTSPFEDRHLVDVNNNESADNDDDASDTSGIDVKTLISFATECNLG